MAKKSSAPANETAKRLKVLRAEYNLTQASVAEKLGLSQQMYSKYESGATVLDADMVRKLCELYGVSADYLLGIEAASSSGNLQQVAFEESDQLIDLIVERAITRMKNENK